MGNQNRTRPAWPIQEIGLTELVGINEQVDQNDFSGSVQVSMGGSGYLTKFIFYQTEDSGGALLSAEGTLFIFDTNPSVASGDTTLTAAEWITCIGKVPLVAADWLGDTGNGQVAYVEALVPYHESPNLWFVFKLTSATSINSAAGDDEQLEFNAWYERWS